MGLEVLEWTKRVSEVFLILLNAVGHNSGWPSIAEIRSF